MSNSSDLGQARQFVGPDPGPNCLQVSSAVDLSLAAKARIILLVDLQEILSDLGWGGGGKKALKMKKSSENDQLKANTEAHHDSF